MDLLILHSQLDIFSVHIIISLVYFTLNSKLELLDQTSRVLMALAVASRSEGEQCFMKVVSSAYWYEMPCSHGYR